MNKRIWFWGFWLVLVIVAGVKLDTPIPAKKSGVHSSLFELSSPSPNKANTPVVAQTPLVEKSLVETPSDDAKSTGPIFIHGVVLQEKKPQANVRVCLNHGKRYPFSAETVTNAQGEYRFEHLPNNQWYVVTAESGEQYGYEYIELFTNDIDRNISLRPGESLPGRTIDKFGKPVAGAEVKAYVLFREASIPVLISDNDGFFRIPFPETFFLEKQSKSAFFSAHKGDMAGFAEVKVQQSGSRQTARIVMSAEAAISGRIVDEKGQPRSEAKVILYPQGVEVMSTETVSDSAGHFSINNLPPTTYILSVMVPYQGKSSAFVRQSQTITLLPGEQVNDLEFTVSTPMASCMGRVVDIHNRPVRGAEVWLHSRVPFENTNECMCRTDEQGRFGWNELPKEEYSISVTGDGYVPYSSSRVYPLPANNITITLQMAAQLSGKVIDATTGYPIELATITLQPVMEAGSANDRVDNAVACTDSQGLFDACYAGFGKLRVYASMDGYSPQEHLLDIAPGELVSDLIFEMQPDIPLNGIVLSAQMKPVDGATVHVEWLNDDAYPESRTDASGMFTMAGIPMQTIPFVVEYNEQEYEFNVDKATLAGRKVELVLPPTGNLRGTLTGAINSAVRIFLFKDMGHITAPVNTDVKDGHFAFDDIPVGSYILRVQCGGLGGDRGRADYTRKVIVSSNRTTCIDINLQQGAASLSGTCRFRGVPARNAELALFYRDAEAKHPMSISTQSDEGGRYAFANLLPGRVILKAAFEKNASVYQGKGYSCLSFAEMEITEGMESFQDIVFHADSTISGEVLGILPEQHVEIELLPGLIDFVNPDLTGSPFSKYIRRLGHFSGKKGGSTFWFDGVEPGEYYLETNVFDPAQGVMPFRTYHTKVCLQETMAPDSSCHVLVH